MLRVHSNSVLVVPPFECAWLAGEEFLFKDGKGCISFEVKGDNDVTVILKAQAGSRRWQHAAASTEGRASPVESNYTVILGSHRNSCLKVEKDGEICCMVNDVPGAKLSSSTFTKFWVNYDDGSITVGSGNPGSHTFYRWTDPNPIPQIRHAGLSAWDKHVAYRHIRLHPVIQPVEGSAQECTWPPTPDPCYAVPSLLDTCCAALHAELAEHSVCSVLEVADWLAPCTAGLRGQVFTLRRGHHLVLPLPSQAITYLAANLQRVLRSDMEGLCGLNTACIADVLRSDSLVCSEKAVFDVVVRWVGYGTPLSRVDGVCRPLQDLDSVLPLVRYPLMSDGELQEVLSHPLSSLTPLLPELVREAVEAREQEGAGGGREQAPPPRGGPLSVQDKRLVRALTPREVAASARFQRRHPPGCSELMYLYDGDHNGVCRFLGTLYSQQEWVNPVLAGRMEVRSSSPSCRFTDPKALVSGNFLPNNFAGPRLEGGRGGGVGAGCQRQLSSWWLLDLGPSHSLAPNYYTLRHDGSSDFLRNWVLQGSQDGASWVDLRRHIDDRRLTKAGQYASWPLVGHAASMPYRMFRVLLIGPNPEAQNRRHVCLSYIELYGYFYKESKA